jgi:hypothetical protein
MDCEWQTRASRLDGALVSSETHAAAHHANGMSPERFPKK